MGVEDTSNFYGLIEQMTRDLEVIDTLHVRKQGGAEWATLNGEKVFDGAESEELNRMSTSGQTLEHDDSERWPEINSILSEGPYLTIVLLRSQTCIDLYLVRTMETFSNIAPSNFWDALKCAAQLGSVQDSNTIDMNRIHTSKMVALGEMASGIAHEINNPLAIIQGHGFLIQKNAQARGSYEKIESGATKILDTVERLTKIVRGMRHFSKSGNPGPKVVLSLKTVVEECLGLCCERFRQYGVKFEIGAIPEDLMIRARSVDVGQALLNVLNNAFDAVVELEEAKIQVEFASDENHVQITVSDNGAKVPSDKQELIFTPFYTSKEVGKHTGLGLSLAVAILKDHDGAIELDQEGEQKKFTITLPSAYASEKKSA